MGRSHQQGRSESPPGLLPCSPGKLIESAWSRRKRASALPEIGCTHYRLAALWGRRRLRERTSASAHLRNISASRGAGCRHPQPVSQRPASKDRRTQRDVLVGERLQTSTTSPRQGG